MFKKEKKKIRKNELAKSLKTYSAQTCSFCKGTGTVFEAICVVCGGKGSVMVKNPAKKCPYCRGIGYILAPNLCMSCKGTGYI